jgi:aryl-alcohol dehydrogenase-like predicted oxidoreductase
VLAQGDDIVPIPGTKRRKYLQQNIGAVQMLLSGAERAALDAAFPRDVAAGARYPEKMQRLSGR